MSARLSSLRRRLPGVRLLLAAAGLVLLVALLAVAPIRPFFVGEAEAVPEAGVDIADMPADLVALAHGEKAGAVIEGETAQQRNAELPFSRTPIEAALPFAMPVSGTTADRALRCLTQAVYYEAGYEPTEGKRAVAQVVLNRMRHPAYPRSVCGVVYDGSTRPGCQFSFTCDGSLRRTPAPAAWAAAERIARAALAGEVASSVGMATHYHADYVSPYWAPRLAKLRQIGTHIFYRWPGRWGRRSAFVAQYAGHEAVYQGRTFTPEGDAQLAAGPQALPPDPTDRHAPNDVGGRLDVTKEWRLTIPDPAETSTHYTEARERQAADRPAPPVALAAGASGDR